MFLFSIHSLYFERTVVCRWTAAGLWDLAAKEGVNLTTSLDDNLTTSRHHQHNSHSYPRHWSGSPETYLFPYPKTLYLPIGNYNLSGRYGTHRDDLSAALLHHPPQHHLREQFILLFLGTPGRNLPPDLLLCWSPIKDTPRHEQIRAKFEA